MRLKNRIAKKNKIINKFSVVLFLLGISIFYVLKIFNDKALPQLISYSEIELKRIISSVISSTIITEIANSSDVDNLFITIKDNNGNIKSIDINSPVVNRVLSRASNAVEVNLKYLQNGDIEKLNISNNLLSSYNPEKIKKGIIYEIPSGIIFNNVLLNNILPKIPVKMNLIENIFCRLKTDINSYGINNALIKVNIVIEVEVRILLPFVSTSTKLSADIPILMKILQGDVPSYYFDGYLNTPSITKNVN